MSIDRTYQSPVAKVLTDRGRRRTRTWLTVSSVSALLLVGLWSQSLQAFRNVQLGESAPLLSAVDRKGRDASPELTKKLTVVLFYRPAQASSLRALEELDLAAKKFSRRKVQIVAVADADETDPGLQTFAEEWHHRFPFLIDRGRRSQQSYGVIVFPSTAIIDAEGRLQLYQPAFPSRYIDRITGKLQVLLGAITEKEYIDLEARIGAIVGADRVEAEKHFAAGMEFWDQGQQEDAIGELTQAVALYPEYKDAHLQLGYLLLDRGDAMGALRSFEEVKQANPRSPSAQMGIGIAHLRLGESQLGIKLLEKAVSINPDPVRGYAELGNAYESQGDLKNAMQYYKWAIAKLLHGRK